MLKAIETVFDGYRFRSRLEARWAVFFKTLGIKYEYEKEGFELGDDVRYLPDFWLPKQSCWIEIKGQEPTEDEHTKCRKLMDLANPDGRRRYTRRPFEYEMFLFAGDIPNNAHFLSNTTRGYCYFPSSEYSHGLFGYGWVECPFCHAVGIAYQCSLEHFHECRCAENYIRMDAINSIFIEKNYNEKIIAEMGDRKCQEIDSLFDDKKRLFLSWHDTPRLIAAYTAARQARFEHGERG